MLMSERSHPERPYTVALVVPTGVGAAIGGYAGDALPVARAIASVADCLISHPNVLNGAMLYWPMPNALYVEGYALDRFAVGDWGLQPVRQNRIGLLLDCGIEDELRLRHLQAADAARATLGLALTDWVLTDAPLGVTLHRAASGNSWGTIARPDSLLRAAEILTARAGAEAIAVVARFPDDLDSPELAAYRQGRGVDPLAGAEAVISHLVVRSLQVPCAHAPALAPLPVDATVSPRAAAEELGYTFLPCVLAGLSRAPQLTRDLNARNGLWATDVDVLVMPATACGGSAVLGLSAAGARIVAVADNTAQTNVSATSLGIEATHVRSYLEALGVLAAWRAGIDPTVLQPRIHPLHCFSENP